MAKIISGLPPGRFSFRDVWALAVPVHFSGVKQSAVNLACGIWWDNFQKLGLISVGFENGRGRVYEQKTNNKE